MPSPRTLTTATHTDMDLRLEHGTWPEDICGNIMFSAPMISGNAPYGLFDPGCIIRLSLRPDRNGSGRERFAWRVVPIDTPGRRLQKIDPSWFSANAVGYRSDFGPLNAANTAPLPWGDRLFVSWDAGRPVELDPVTLEFIAEVGTSDSWLSLGGPGDGAPNRSPDTTGSANVPAPPFGDTLLPTLLTCAHPAVDTDRGGLWTTRLDPSLTEGLELVPSVVWWDPDRTTVDVWPLEDISFRGSTHTISQTRDWLIIADSGNFRADLEEILGGERTVTIDPDAPVWLVRKDELLATAPGTPVKPVCSRVAPPSGHFYARHDDSEGISIIWEGMDLMDLGLHIRPDDVDITGRAVDPASVGLYNMAMAPSTITELVLDPRSGAVTHRSSVREDWSMNLELSAMDWSIEGITSPELHHVSYQGCRPDRITERAANMYVDRTDRGAVLEETPGVLVSFERGSLTVRSRWEYPDTSDLITSPTFVPRDPGSTGSTSRYAGSRPGGADGYVVQPVHSDDGFRVEVFDAADVGAGPIATLSSANRECVPLLLHSAWMPDVERLVDAPRVRFGDEVTEARLSGLDDTQRRAVADVVAALEY